MKVSRWRAAFLLVVSPARLKQISASYNEHINTPESIAARQKQNAEAPYHIRSIDRIRQGLIYSLLLVVGAAVVAAILGRIALALCKPIPNGVLELIQYIGIGILLWATLAKQGWSIQTFDGTTIPEQLDDSIYRWLYVFGSFLLALAISMQLAT